ncbi:hypothetical protein GWO43_21350 [candidate division KSB1 bacterium]|nr:hypothetical protein [candidate division KSB1 bacterium]NIR72139.1 hypothetical protein [candidate division KSB1 bacterium]NIS26604.1 hypothetical protein [candidate division KSB1 bacterium]NIT73372.1 hypothetical protein [candidate division KSB1 bacterium]NIU27220.1 hypothetical protein [candidate division KSB1 bacterium]
MSLFRLIVLGFLFYLAFKLISGFFRLFEGEKKQNVEGKSRGNPPLDLNDHDVEDADFEDIK